MAKRRIYLDYATTTPVDDKVLKAMRPFWNKDFGNPSSVHHEGVKAAEAVKNARNRIAHQMQAHADEIVFTASGSESNNLAILGLVNQLRESGKKSEDIRILVSVIEHSSVMSCAEKLQREGVRVEYIPVDSYGIIKMQELERMLEQDASLVSVMAANNEIGTIQPILKVSKLIKRHNEKSRNKIYFHTDACQAAGYLKMEQDRLGADMISIDSHKLYGPKGIGMLYVRRGVKLSSLIHGGEQEGGLRAGTENVPLISGFAEAFAYAQAIAEKESERVSGLRDYFIRELSRYAKFDLNGHSSLRLPNNVNISVPGLNSEFAVIRLDSEGVSCSTKSACLEGEKSSYVIRSLGKKDGADESSIRFTLGRYTTKKDMKDAARIAGKILSA